MSLMASQGHKVGKSLKLLYLHQRFSQSVNQKLKISQILMAIMLAY